MKRKPTRPAPPADPTPEALAGFLHHLDVAPNRKRTALVRKFARQIAAQFGDRAWGFMHHLVLELNDLSNEPHVLVPKGYFRELLATKLDVEAEKQERQEDTDYKLLAFVKARLPHMSVKQAIREARKQPEWTNIPPATLRQTYYRHRKRPPGKVGRLQL